MINYINYQFYWLISKLNNAVINKHYTVLFMRCDGEIGLDFVDV